MPSVTFVQPDGSEREVDVVAGTSLKDAALRNEVDGIVGECGGYAICATCHVYVDEAWEARLPEPDDVEHDVLDDTVAPREATSRLSCQIEVSDALDGLRVRVPDEQV